MCNRAPGGFAVTGCPPKRGKPDALGVTNPEVVYWACGGQEANMEPILSRIELDKEHDSQYFEILFRQVRTAHEMRDALALRYRVLSKIQTESSLDHSSMLEADNYDFFATHFILVARVGRRESVVGTVRFVAGQTSPQLALLYAVSATHPRLAALMCAPISSPLPMLSYLEHGGALSRYVAECTSRGERIVEASRFILDPRILTLAGRRGQRISQQAMLAAIAVACIVDPVDRVLIDARCSWAFLERLYRSFGFERAIAVTGPTRATSGEGFVVLEATPHSVPSTLRPQVFELAKQLLGRGEARLKLASLAVSTRPTNCRQAIGSPPSTEATAAA